MNLFVSITPESFFMLLNRPSFLSLILIHSIMLYLGVDFGACLVFVEILGSVHQYVSSNFGDYIHFALFSLCSCFTGTLSRLILSCGLLRLCSFSFKFDNFYWSVSSSLTFPSVITKLLLSPFSEWTIWFWNFYLVLLKNSFHFSPEIP